MGTTFGIIVILKVQENESLPKQYASQFDNVLAQQSYKSNASVKENNQYQLWISLAVYKWAFPNQKFVFPLLWLQL